MVYEDVGVVDMLVERAASTLADFAEFSQEVGVALMDATFGLNLDVVTTLHF